MKSTFGDSEKILKRLRDSIGESPEPVVPLRPAWQRALLVAAAGILFTVALLVVMGLREDAESIGFTAIWVFSGLQLISVYFLAWLTLQEAVPGEKPPRAAIWLTAAGAVLMHLTVVLASDRMSTNPLPEELSLRLALICLTFVALLGLPLAFVAWNLVRKGLPDDWPAVGLLVGLLAGLAAESGWRIHCPYSDWKHILSAHSGAILFLTLAGTLIGRLWLSRKS